MSAAVYAQEKATISQTAAYCRDLFCQGLCAEITTENSVYGTIRLQTLPQAQTRA